MGRVEKVANAIKEETGSIIQNELRDPRLGFITVMRVELTKDLQLARIYCSVMGSEDKKDKAMEGLESARGFIRRLLSERLKLRLSPELVFKLDKSVDYSIEISETIERIKNESKKGRGADKKT
ncbi:MAG: ribosome-binding factor A [Omnitrophica WOR_2 bacterium RIFCSPHIGHO2_02_FULL_45_21]|nr:MAG: ribosome-binding factor A [Omnitrophica WOR_2 bacterium RIFCSPHIGHO2_02_FULL_45_21]